MNAGTSGGHDYLWLYSKTVHRRGGVKSWRIKSLLAEQPVGFVTPFTLLRTQTHPVQTKLVATMKEKTSALATSHLHFNFSSFLHIKGSSLG